MAKSIPEKSPLRHIHWAGLTIVILPNIGSADLSFLRFNDGPGLSLAMLTAVLAPAKQ